ncbi:MAG: ABC transporter substrate-binding protein [Spirochaetota bacterium]
MKYGKLVRVLLLSVGFLLVLGISQIAAGGKKEEAKEVPKQEPVAVQEKAPAVLEFEPAVGEWKWWDTLQDYEKETGKTIREFYESPMLKEKVAAGELPSVKERLPEQPVVVQPIEAIGKYSDRPLRMDSVGQDTGVTHLSGSMDFSRGVGRWNRSLTKVVPDVVKGWQLSEDGKTHTIFFRKGGKWSDGEPVTADDMLFWWEDVMLNDKLIPETPAPYMPGGELMKAEKVDDYTIRFHFAVSYPAAPMLVIANWSFRLLPKHFLKQYHIKYNKEANELAKKEGYDQWWELMNAMLGFFFPGYQLSEELNRAYPVLGAWKFQRRVPGGIVWERNPYYHHVDTAGNQLPYIDKIITSRTEDAEVFNMRAVAGEVDFGSWGIQLAKYPLFLKAAKEGKYRVQLAGMSDGSVFSLYTNMNYNKDSVLAKILHDLRFRQAVSLAIDRNEINEALFFGKGVPRQDTVTPPADYYKEEWAKAYAQHDPQEANRLLDEMGLKWGTDHEYRQRPDGKRLQVIVTTTGEMYAYYIPMMEIIVANWKEIGVEAKINAVSKQAMYDAIYTNEAQMWGRTMTVTTHAGFIFFEAYWWRPKWWAPLWDEWLITNGKKGEEPPEWVKKFSKTIHSLRYLPKKELNEAMTYLLDTSAEKLFKIGTIGMVPEPAVIANDLGNVPERFWSASSVSAQGLIHVGVEEFYWKK